MTQQVKQNEIHQIDDADHPTTGRYSLCSVCKKLKHINYFSVYQNGQPSRRCLVCARKKADEADRKRKAYISSLLKEPTDTEPSPCWVYTPEQIEEYLRTGRSPERRT